jgi:hypothetical protein
MKKIVTGLVLVVVMGAVVLMTVGTAAAKPPAGQVCPEEGKVEVSGEQHEITGLAPGDVYCVKAGSVKQGYGAVPVTVGYDGKLSHPSGKAISHYSPLEVDEEPPSGDPPGDEPCPDEGWIRDDTGVCFLPG